MIFEYVRLVKSAKEEDLKSTFQRLLRKEVKVYTLGGFTYVDIGYDVTLEVPPEVKGWLLVDFQF